MPWGLLLQQAASASGGLNEHVLGQRRQYHGGPPGLWGHPLGWGPPGTHHVAAPLLRGGCAQTLVDFLNVSWLFAVY